MSKGKTSANNSGVNLYRLALFVCHKTKLMARPDKIPRYEVTARPRRHSHGIGVGVDVFFEVRWRWFHFQKFALLTTLPTLMLVGGMLNFSHYVTSVLTIE